MISKSASLYAKAVFELMPGAGLDEVLGAFRLFCEAMETHAGLKVVASGVGIDPGVRARVVTDIILALGIRSDLASKCLQLLAKRGRLSELSQVITAIEQMQEVSRGIVSGRVRTAVELTADEIGVLADSLSKKIGKKVRLAQFVDTDLLGGVVADVEGKTFDASLRTQLNKFKNL